MKTFYEYMTEAAPVAAAPAAAQPAQQAQQQVQQQAQQQAQQLAQQLPNELSQSFKNLSTEQQNFLAQTWAYVPQQARPSALALLQPQQQAGQPAGQPVAGQPVAPR